MNAAILAAFTVAGLTLIILFKKTRDSSCPS
jgi:hypothetical protein